MTGNLFTAVDICRACHRVFVVDECYPCYKARLDREKEEEAAILRAAEVDCPTTARPSVCATYGDHPVGWCSMHNRRLEICRKQTP